MEATKVTVELDTTREVRVGLGSIGAICRETGLGFTEIQKRLNDQRFDTMLDVVRAIIIHSDPNAADMDVDDLLPADKFQTAFGVLMPALMEVATAMSGSGNEPEEDVEAPGKENDG